MNSVIPTATRESLSDYEAMMFLLYKKNTDMYQDRFIQLGYELIIEQWWTNVIHHVKSTQPLPIRNGYECLIYCCVKKNGTPVKLKSRDGEADFYTLETTWAITTVFRKFFKRKISLSSELGKVTSDLDRFLFQLKNT